MEFADFAKVLRGTIGEGAESLSDLFKNVKTPVADLDSVLKNAEIGVDDGGNVLINGRFASEFEVIFKSGDINKVMSFFGKDIEMSGQVRAMFKSAMADFPESTLEDVATETKFQKTRLPDLDVEPESFEREKLTKSQVSAYDSFFKKFKLYFATASTVVGVTAVIVIGADMYSALKMAADERKGCFLMVQKNGQTSSCKLIDRSCNNSQPGQHPCSDTQISEIKLKHNAVVWLMHYAMLENQLDAAYQEIQALLPSVTLNMASISQFLTHDIFKRVRDLYDNLETDDKTITWCYDKDPHIESGVVPPCRACNSTASILSTQYVDTSALGSNYSLTCITETSIIGTLADVAIGTGIDILSWIGNNPLLRNIGIAFVVVVVSIIVLSVLSKFFSKT